MNCRSCNLFNRDKARFCKWCGARINIQSDHINKKDIDNIPEIYLKGLKFHYVNDIREVLDIALTDEVVTNAPKLTIPETNKDNDNK